MDISQTPNKQDSPVDVMVAPKHAFMEISRLVFMPVNVPLIYPHLHTFEMSHAKQKSER